MGKLPLEGIRVLDFGWIYAVPHATAWLGALGADVIKVETNLFRDMIRDVGATDGVPGPNRCGIFNAINFSKRSLVLNLHHPEAQEIARRLVRLSDIVTENFTVGNMQKFGLDYESLLRVRPDLIMLSGTPLGQSGPMARSVGYGPTTQAFAGMCHLTGYPGRYPCGTGGTWPDFAVGVLMVFLTLCALHHRDATGEGQYLDLSMAEVVTSMLPEAMLEFFLNGVSLEAVGNRDPAMAPHGVFAARGDERWVALAIATDAEFEMLCEVLGEPRLAADPRFAHAGGRLENVDALEAEVARLVRNFDRDELVARLCQRGLAACAVYSTPELMNDPAWRESQMRVTVTHPECGERIIPGLPVWFSDIQPGYRAAPLLGGDTDQILSELLGYSTAEIERLKSERVTV